MKRRRIAETYSPCITLHFIKYMEIIIKEGKIQVKERKRVPLEVKRKKVINFLHKEISRVKPYTITVPLDLTIYCLFHLLFSGNCQECLLLGSLSTLRSSFRSPASSLLVTVKLQLTLPFVTLKSRNFPQGKNLSEDVF